MTAGGITSRWRNAGVLILVLFTCGAIVYRDSLAGLVEIWLRSDTFAHGIIVFPISGWLTWNTRDALFRIAPRASLVGAVLLGCAAFAWLLGRLAGAQVVQQLAVIAMLPATVWLLLGRRVVACLAFPLAFLFFAVPLGEGLIPILMDSTAALSVWALELTGIPVYRDGLYFSIPSGDFEVAKACSGIRYLIASVALGSLYAYLTYHAWWRRALFVMMSIAVPILANGLRAYGIVMIAHLSNMRLAVGVDHLIYGWLFFGIVMFLLFWAGLPFRDAAPSREPDTPDSRGGRGRADLTLAAAGGLLLIFAAPLAADWVQNRAVQASVVAPVLPSASGSWSGPLEPTLAWQPVFRGADQELLARYERGGRSVHVVVAYYSRQEQGAELVNSQNVVTDASWLQMSQGRQEVTHTAGGPATVITTRLRAAADPMLMWHWYVVGNHTTASASMVKLLEAFDGLRGQRSGAALVALIAPEDDSSPVAHSILSDFLAAHGPAFGSRMLPTRVL